MYNILINIDIGSRNHLTETDHVPSIGIYVDWSRGENGGGVWEGQRGNIVELEEKIKGVKEKVGGGGGEK